LENDYAKFNEALNSSFLMITMKYNVLIIGAGNIGALFDEPLTDNILTHAHAFIAHNGFNLVGFVDVSIEKVDIAISRWGGKGFENIHDAFYNNKIDVVSIAVPDEHHYEVLRNVSEYPVEFVFAEKPLTKKIGDAVEIMSIYKEKNISLLVNYSRRFVPEFEKIKDDIHRGIYGRYLSGVGFYGKGINHNGSHLIDLIRYFIGEIQNSKVIDYSFDYYDDDPSVSGILTLVTDNKFYLQHVDCNLYSIFELDMFFEKKRIKIKDLGFVIEEYDVKKSGIFLGYRNIVKTGESRTSLGKAMYYAVENIFNFLENGAIIKCSGYDGYKALEVCTDIVKRAKI
jgi:predicted dehydrogenase